MSVITTKRPEIIVEGQVMKWNAVHHPITYEIQRSDQNCVIMFRPPGWDTIIKVIGAVPANVAVGDRIQYHSPTGQIYDFDITNIQPAGSYFNIFTNGNISGVTYGGFVIYPDTKANYHVEAIVRVLQGLNQWIELGTVRTVPDTTGKMKVRINKWLRGATTFLNAAKYTPINEAIQGEGTRFSITYREMFDGSIGAIQGGSGSHYFTNSAKQIQEKHGTNMAEFTPFPDDPREEKAKFLSVFKKPTYFPGYPFSLNFIYGDLLGNRQITREEDEFDLNGNINIHNTDNLDLSQRYFNNRLTLSGSFPTTTKEVDVWLDAGDAADDEDGHLGNKNGYSDRNIFEPWVEGPDQPPIKPVVSVKNEAR